MKGKGMILLVVAAACLLMGVFAVAAYNPTALPDLGTATEPTTPAGGNSSTIEDPSTTGDSSTTEDPSTTGDSSTTEDPSTTGDSSTTEDPSRTPPSTTGGPSTTPPPTTAARITTLVDSEEGPKLKVWSLNDEAIDEKLRENSGPVLDPEFESELLGEARAPEWVIENPLLAESAEWFVEDLDWRLEHGNPSEHLEWWRFDEHQSHTEWREEVYLLVQQVYAYAQSAPKTYGELRRLWFKDGENREVVLRRTTEWYLSHPEMVTEFVEEYRKIARPRRDKDGWPLEDYPKYEVKLISYGNVLMGFMEQDGIRLDRQYEAIESGRRDVPLVYFEKEYMQKALVLVGTYPNGEMTYVKIDRGYQPFWRIWSAKKTVVAKPAPTPAPVVTVDIPEATPTPASTPKPGLSITIRDPRPTPPPKTTPKPTPPSSGGGSGGGGGGRYTPPTPTPYYEPKDPADGDGYVDLPEPGGGPREPGGDNTEERSETSQPPTYSAPAVPAAVPAGDSSYDSSIDEGAGGHVAQNQSDAASSTQEAVAADTNQDGKTDSIVAGDALPMENVPERPLSDVQVEVVAPTQGENGAVIGSDAGAMGPPK